METSIELNRDQEAALERFRTGKNIFLTGGAGTGKSLVLTRIVAEARKKPEWVGRSKAVAVTSLTGVSSHLIRGQTLHSWAGIGLGKGPVEQLLSKIRKKGKWLANWMEAQLLIIDEVSMLDMELFEKLDQIGRQIRSTEGIDRWGSQAKQKLFGGMQLILAGDFCQLPPVKAPRFCFESKVWKKHMSNAVVYLTQIMRQQDQTFQKILSQVRLGRVSAESRKILQSRLVKEIPKYRRDDVSSIQPTVLYPYKKDVALLNQTHLQRLTEGSVSADARIYVPEYSYSMQGKKVYGRARDLVRRQLERMFGPVPSLPLKGSRKFLEYPALNHNRANYVSELCLGAQVMLTYNMDVANGLVNGSRGVITRFASVATKNNGGSGGGGSNEDCPVVRFDNDKELPIERLQVTTESDEYDIIVSQFPLELAWSYSIHKSQGATLTNVITDLSNVFSPGQAYVSLSRVRSLEGLHLLGINFSNITCHPRVKKYYQDLVYKCRFRGAIMIRDRCLLGSEYPRLTSPYAVVGSCPDCLEKALKRWLQPKSKRLQVSNEIIQQVLAILRLQ